MCLLSPNKVLWLCDTRYAGASAGILDAQVIAGKQSIETERVLADRAHVDRLLGG
jgi:hypothetical protein